jgi:peptide/nickel transport system substrate-binding protein
MRSMLPEQKHTSRFLLPGMLLITLLVLAQCSDNNSTSTLVPPAPTTTSTSTLAPTPTSTLGPTATPFATPTAVPSSTSAAPPDDLVRGGILRFAVPEGSPHMDPHLTVSIGLLSWGAGQAYSRLFKFDAVDGDATITCDLCESWTQPGPLSFSVQLRKNVKWQNLPPLNGRNLTAQDVVYSLKRQAGSSHPNAPLLSNIAEFTAVGEHEVLIRLKSPDAETLEKLADSHSRIVSPEAVDVNGDLRRGPTVGTGPWIASESQTSNTQMVVNPDYYDEAPYLDGLDIQVIASQSTRVAGMRTKVIDLSQASFDDIVSSTERFEDIEWTEISNPSAGVEIAINTARSPMDKQAVRDAMMLTWDPGSWNEKLWNGQSEVSTGVPMLNPKWHLAADEFRSRFSDSAAANLLLSSAEIKPTDSVVIKVGEYGQQYIYEATAMAEGLASVGIRAEVERVSTRKFGDEVWTSGDFDIAVGAPPPIASTTGYLFAVHHSNGPWNTTGYVDAEIDRMIEAQAREYDPVKRRDLLVELQRRILAGSHRFIASTRTTNWMWWDYVHDFHPATPRGNTDFLTRVWMTERPPKLD